MVLVLSTCTQLGALDHERWVHAYVERYKIRMMVTLGVALGDMYVEAKLHDESKLIQRCFDDSKDDDKGDDKKLKGQSKNEFKMFKIESITLQDSRGKLISRIKNQDSRIKLSESRSKFKTQDSRIKRRLNQDKGYIYLGLTENKIGYISCGSVLVEGTSTRFKENKGGYIPRGSLLVKGFLQGKKCLYLESAIGGLAMNGFGLESLDLFYDIKREGVQPNGVTFISVLKGCNVVGLVEKGRKHFDSMMNVYGIDPRLKHYGLMVDMYSRAGHLEEALNFINSMPMKPMLVHGVLCFMLVECIKTKNSGELSKRNIVELEDKNDCAYVLKSMLPGCSVIEVDGEVHEFIVGDKSHPRYGEIELKLEEISKCLRLDGNVVNTNTAF
ncbi:putative pentatricopeptide repeat-containing protein [Glycine soja]|uniref:Putative pentatricopeptide repeat-containing protein n=1 Tax=Glycine soja TaxID=3848 RepID=A0A445FSE8_GLYSO|nr:putative pentatricopeptide repeat-containing protein [Glycine soja]